MRQKKIRLAEEILNEGKSRWEMFSRAAEAHAAIIEGDKDFFEELLQIWGFSDFIAKSCLRNPDILMDLVESTHLLQSYPADFYQEKLNTLLTDFSPKSTIPLANADLAKQIPSLQHLLRNFRRR